MGIILVVLGNMVLLSTIHNVPIYVGVLVLIGGIAAVAVSGTLLSPRGTLPGQRNLPEYYQRREELKEKIQSYRKMMDDDRNKRQRPIKPSYK